MLRKYTTINWEQSLLALMPPLLRKKKHALWLNTLFKPLSSVYDDTLYKMQHTGQVVYLEKVLNEFFNKSRQYKAYNTTGEKLANGLIFINDASRPEVQYQYTHSEIESGYDPFTTYVRNEPIENRNVDSFLFLASDLDFNSTEYFNFRVNIPSDLITTAENLENEVNSIINNNTITEKEKQEVLKIINCKLIKGGEHPFTTHPDAVRIETPIFHKILNFYKLAGKSYETRVYNNFDVE